MLKFISIVVVVVVAGLLVFAATRPNTFRIARTETIKAPPEKIFPLINDFHQWAAWSPFEKMDPAMKKTFSGAAAGKGSVYAWEGPKIGSGRMEVLEATPTKVTIQLDFLKPMTARNTAEFTLEAKDGGTNVTWAMFGPNPYLAKIMHIFISMDKMVGKDFETGLSNLKTLAEK